MKGNLYLIPTPLGDTSPDNYLTSYYIDIIIQLKHFAVEELKTARRFLRKIDRNFDIDASQFVVIGKKSKPGDLEKAMGFLENGNDTGLLSEAGMPCIADPGSELVKMAHDKDIRVVPFPGPSSILLALTGSGMNGQQFTFHGYLPIREPERKQKIRELEAIAGKTGYTQIFMETPYRNNSLLKDIISVCQPETQLCIAADLTLPTEYIKMENIRRWKSKDIDLHKRPAIFLISAG